MKRAEEYDQHVHLLANVRVTLMPNESLRRRADSTRARRTRKFTIRQMRNKQAGLAQLRVRLMSQLTGINSMTRFK